MSIDQGTEPRHKSSDISIFQKLYAKSSVLNSFERCKVTVDRGAMQRHKSVFLPRVCPDQLTHILRLWEEWPSVHS